MEDMEVSWDKTILEFSRDWDTCDDDDYLIDVRHAEKN